MNHTNLPLVEKTPEQGDAGERCSVASGSAIQRAASTAAARIVHHSRWPARADEAHALAGKIILGEMRRVICTAVDHECTCGGNPPESLAACPACLVWHRIYSSPNTVHETTRRTDPRQRHLGSASSKL